MSRKYRSVTWLYYLWLVLFVITPLMLLFLQSFQNIEGNWSLINYLRFFTEPSYILMTLNSFIYAFFITLICLLIGYPFAYFLSKTRYKQFLLLLIILPTWINLLLKAYAFIGIFSRNGSLNDFLSLFGVGPIQLLFTDIAFVLVATYIELPFMILPIFRSIDEIPLNYHIASLDLGASRWQTFLKVTLPLSLNGVRSGIQAVFIPSLSLFMISRLIGGNRIITLGTAVEQHYLVTQDWGMGSVIGIVLIALMMVIMILTRKKESGR